MLAGDYYTIYKRRGFLQLARGENEAQKLIIHAVAEVEYIYLIRIYYIACVRLNGIICAKCIYFL